MDLQDYLLRILYINEDNNEDIDDIYISEYVDNDAEKNIFKYLQDYQNNFVLASLYRICNNSKDISEDNYLELLVDIKRYNNT